MNDMTKPPAEKPSNFPAMLKTWLPEIQRALPKHMNGERMSRIALTAFRQSPFLAKCDPLSVFAAVVQSAQLGLEVGLMGEAHLVPFKTKQGWKCQLIPGYQGLMKLARNSGLIEDIYAHEVRERDEFEMTLGMTRLLTHKPLMHTGFPASEDERGAITGFYCVAVFKDGTKTFTAMARHEVERIRDNSKGYQAAKRDGKESPWDTEFVEMGKKTVIRRQSKYLPKSPELALALALDDAAYRGKEQGLNVEAALEGTWAPVEDDPEAPEAERAEAQKPTLPAYDAQAFKKNLSGWLKMIADGKKSADDVVAMLSTKNTLTVEQVGLIHGWDTQPASTEQFTDLQAAAARAALTDVEVAKHLKVAALDKITVAQFHAGLAFCANPAGSVA